MSSHRGAIIVLEGLDRVGKSTQATKLIDWFRKQGLLAELIRFPDRTTLTGQMISDYLGGKVKLNDHLVHLLFTANRWEKYDEMIEKVQSGINLIIDRYSYSGVAYTAAKGLDVDWCKAPEQGLPRPDCVLFLDYDFQKTNQYREKFGEEIYERTEFQRSVYEVYMKLRKPNWNTIESNEKSIEQVHENIIEIVQKNLKQIPEEISKLW
ncbi:thymidylate kinase-like protein [Sarcoptes scabiei]|uniref:Thymidylate kinase n=1 Tax=Sarcoptes scabiei TaxID=52283 RepID=A0A132AEK7_SARSC|nr:thymidylate kinase-like protein [Sarcoptes scabiei]